DRTEANPNELNQDDARYGFRCCHLKNIWTAPLPPETELSRQMTTSTTSIDIMGLQAAYANLHTDQERDYFMQRYHDVISSFGGKTRYKLITNVRSSLMAVNIHITIIELNALHTKRQNLFQELDAVIHLLMEAKHWGLRKSRNATSLNSRFKSLDTLKVKIISVTFRMKIYHWEGVNPDGYFLDKLEPIPSALPSFQKLFQVSATALSIPRKISTTPEAASVTTLEISFAVAPI